MFNLTTDTFERPQDLTDNKDPKVLFARSYLLTRTVIGTVGLLVPTALFALDNFFLDGSASLRGSLSAYYHSAARDLFVGALCVIGVLLLTYMAGKVSSWDFWISSLAGVGLLGVALIPTKRPNLADGVPLCGPAADSVPAGCTPLQQRLGEDTVVAFHHGFTAMFVAGIGVMCVLFAIRQARHHGRDARFWLYVFCGGTIAAAVLWIFLGLAVQINIFSFSPLYVGEIMAVYAFGVAWLINGLDFWKVLFPRLSKGP